MKNSLTVYLVLLLTSCVYSQITFEKTYCFTSYATAITSNYDSGYIVLCREYQSQNLLMRLDKYGDTIWAKPGFFVSDCEISNDTNIVTISQFANDDLMLTKLDQTGNKIWEKKIGGFTNVFNDILKTPDNGYLLTGAFYDTNTFEYSAGFIKTDSFGDTLWTQRFSDGNVNTQEAGYFSIIGNDGNYYFCGTTYAYGITYLPSTLLVGSVTPQGILRISKIFYNSIGNFAEYTGGISSLPFGGFMVCTTCDTNGNGDNVIRLYRFNDNCDTIWCRQLENQAKESAGYGMSLTSDGNLMIAGYVMVDSASVIYKHAYIAKVDTSAMIIWDRLIGNDFTEFWRICNAQDNGYVFLGKSLCSNNSNACYLVKTDENGLITGIGEPPTGRKPVPYAIEPNPITGQTISLRAYEGFKGPLHFEVLASTGQCVRKGIVSPGVGNTLTTLQLPGVAKGLYLLVLQPHNSTMAGTTLKLMVN